MDRLERPFGVDFDKGAFEYCGLGTAVLPSPTISYDNGLVTITWNDIPANELYQIYGDEVPYLPLVAGNWKTAVDTNSYLDNISNNQNHFYSLRGAVCAGNEASVASEVGIFHFVIANGN